MRTLVFVTIALMLCWASAFSQADSTGSERSASFDLMFGHAGVSFGNGQRMNGLRFAWRDGDFELVNGMNVSFWNPYDEPHGEVNGISFGIVGPGGERSRGLTIGIGGALMTKSMDGLNIGGLGLVSQGTVAGISIAGLGVVTQGGMSGFSFAGLGVVSQGPMTGVNAASLGVISQGSMTGINFGGLGTVSQGGIVGFNFGGLGLVGQKSIIGVGVAGLGLVSQAAVQGVNFAGLGLVAQGKVQGVSIAGLGLVGQGGISGLTIAGAGIVSNKAIAGISTTLGLVKSGEAITGLTFGGYKLESPLITGINLAIGWTESRELTGFTCAAYNRTDGLQKGLVIGIVNSTEDILGIQIGVLNYVAENPAGLKYLPVFNARF